MAGVGAYSEIRGQVALVARLRWQLYRNSLRTLRGRLEAVSVIFIWLMTTGLVLGGGLVMGVGAYLLTAHHSWKWLPLLLWIVFLYWQLFPLFSAAVGVQFDFANLLRFPLRYGSFLSLSLAYGLFDPGAIAALFWLLCASVGIGMARPLLFPWALLVLLIFAAMNLFLARMLLSWTERWLAQRKTREIVGFLFILFIISFQLIGPIAEHFQRQHARPNMNWINVIFSVAQVLPPGFAGEALIHALEGRILQSGGSLVVLTFYALAFFCFFHIRLKAQFHGENLGEAPALPARKDLERPGSIAGAKNAAFASWKIPWLSSATSAVLEKEVRYAFRSGPALLTIFLPPIIVIILGFSLHQQSETAQIVQQTHGMAFPIAVGYAFLVQMNWVFNSFAYEGTGIQFLLLAPVPFRAVTVGKNLFSSGLTLFEVFALWAVVSWIFPPPPAIVVVATFAALLYASLANFAIGNILSVCFPRKLDFGMFRQKRLAGVTMAVGFATQIVLLGSSAAIFGLTNLFGRVTYAVPIFLALAVAAGAGYVTSLNRIDKLAQSHRETLTAELCRAE